MHSNHTTTFVVSNWKGEAHLTAVQYFSVERTSTVPTLTSAKVISGDVKHIYRQPRLHFVCVCVCVCLYERENVCVSVQWLKECHTSPDNIGFITMAQTVVNKISTFNKVQLFFSWQTALHQTGLIMTFLSVRLSWLCTFFQFEKMRVQWRDNNIQYTFQREKPTSAVFACVYMFVSVRECVYMGTSRMWCFLLVCH